MAMCWFARAAAATIALSGEYVSRSSLTKASSDLVRRSAITRNRSRCSSVRSGFTSVLLRPVEVSGSPRAARGRRAGGEDDQVVELESVLVLVSGDVVEAANPKAVGLVDDQALRPRGLARQGDLHPIAAAGPLLGIGQVTGDHARSSRRSLTTVPFSRTNGTWMEPSERSNTARSASGVRRTVSVPKGRQWVRSGQRVTNPRPRRRRSTSSSKYTET